MLIFEKGRKGRVAQAHLLRNNTDHHLPSEHVRADLPGLPEVSELDVVRHYTGLSKKNFSIDTHFYPLGSCTMKYNPRVAHVLASSEAFLSRHPFQAEESSEGFLCCLYELQEILKSVTGMTAVSLAPMAGAQGELAGVLMIRAYHRDRGDFARTEILVPDAAHGTNPASAVMAGFQIRTIRTLQHNGDLDLEELSRALGPQTAGIMLTNPSTLGVFERQIEVIAQKVHEAGGLLYYDGANFNAILGQVRPIDMGFDVVHVNLHKTFATPHGGGGPGSGPVAAGPKLAPYLPVPMVSRHDVRPGKKAEYCWQDVSQRPQTIGRLSAFMGQAGILLRAYVYARLLGKEGLKAVSEMAVLNANYLMQGLKQAGFEVVFPERRATHEFMITFRSEAKEYGVSAMDVAKRLLDYGFHAPTTYFPLLVPECFLIEPTETESKETLDLFIDAMSSILQEIKNQSECLKQAPKTLSVSRLDDVKAAKVLDIVSVIKN